MGGAAGAGGAAVVLPPHEIDIATAPLLRERIERAGAGHPEQVVVDCGDVTFCDSTVVAVLLHARSALEDDDCALVVVNAPPLLRRVATMLGQADRLGIPTG
jgi:anti-sigma B factor antagonist